jgi:hypothetical protein
VKFFFFFSFKESLLPSKDPVCLSSYQSTGQSPRLVSSPAKPPTPFRSEILRCFPSTGTCIPVNTALVMIIIMLTPLLLAASIKPISLPGNPLGPHPNPPYSRNKAGNSTSA